ncbi:MAG: cupin domain-containing protein [Candidatus Kryptonium sp.]|nr:cupin domain-containing protein [Candidatus Kryptonium sp.]MCX7762073.1 cupin domain-containing protein [Candidatus Kryptonium sp.]MDW8108323.1 cupin domain-containing protein [Candidatus Kryptonium sp.]
MKITRWDKQNKPTVEELEKILISEGTRPHIWTDEPGTYYGNHSHPFDEIRWVVSGKMRYGVGNEEFVLGPGDRLDLPAGTVHWAKVEGDEPVVYLCASK